MDNDTPSFWIRGGALMIDGIIMIVASIVPALILPEPLLSIVEFLMAGAYFTIMPVAYNGQTVGKMAAGLKIVREDGSPLTYGRACARWLGYILSELTLGLGFICAHFTKRKRALHDYVAGTRVIKIKEPSPRRKLIMILLGALLPVVLHALRRVRTPS